MDKLGKGVGDSSGCGTKNNSRAKELGKKKKSGNKNLKKPWMEVQIIRKKPKTGEFLYFIIKLICYICDVCFTINSTNVCDI